MKQARKVALVNVADYPRDQYTGYWEIHVDDSDPENDGFAWAARVYAYQPVAWLWNGKRTATRPDAPHPAFPPDVRVKQNDYMKLKPEDQAAVRKLQEARRAECRKIHAAHPQPVHLVAEQAGVGKTRDEADTAAQTWVIEQMKGMKKPAGAGVLGSFALAGGPVVADLCGELALWLRRLLRPMLASLIAYSTTIRSNRMTQVLNAIDGGSGAGLIRIYDSTRPATGGTATTKLAELTCSDPSGSVSSAVLTFSAITADSSADATGTATWGRIVDSSATFCVDFNVGTSGSDLNLNTTSITSGVNVAISSMTLTDGSS